MVNCLRITCPNSSNSNMIESFEDKEDFYNVKFKSQINLKFDKNDILKAFVIFRKLYFNNCGYLMLTLYGEKIYFHQLAYFIMNKELLYEEEIKRFYSKCEELDIKPHEVTREKLELEFNNIMYKIFISFWNKGRFNVNENAEILNIDHINSDRWDNRKCNLQTLTPKENINKKLSSEELKQIENVKIMFKNFKRKNKKKNKKIDYDITLTRRKLF